MALRLLAVRVAVVQSIRSVSFHTIMDDKINELAIS